MADDTRCEDGAVERARRSGAVAAARALSVPRRAVVLVRTAVILGLYASAVVTVLALPPAAGWCVGALLAPALGFLLSGFFNAAHDCVHRTHMLTAAGNRIAGVLWSVPVLSNFSIYRRSHLVHHRRTGLEGDTEPPQKLDGIMRYLASVSGVGYWRFVVGTMVRCWRGSLPEHADRQAAFVDNAVLSIWIAAALLATFAFPRALILTYWLPLACSAPWMILLAIPEHYGLEKVPTVDHNARTVTSNAVVRFVQWNANYHADHHRFPGVPAVNLPRLRRTSGTPPGENIADSYAGFHARLVASLLRAGADRSQSGDADRPQGNTI